MNQEKEPLTGKILNAKAVTRILSNGEQEFYVIFTIQAQYGEEKRLHSVCKKAPGVILANAEELRLEAMGRTGESITLYVVSVENGEKGLLQDIGEEFLCCKNDLARS